MRVASPLAQSLMDEAQACPSVERARAIAASIDDALDHPGLSPGDRGTLLTARAIAGQHFEPATETKALLVQSLAPLEAGGEFERLVASLASAAIVSRMLGHAADCMEFAVKALTIAGSDQVVDLPLSVPANLSTLFNEFSAFDLAFDLANEAFDAAGTDVVDGRSMLIGFGLCRTIIEAAWQLEADQKTRARLDVAAGIARRILDGDADRARTLIGNVLLSEIALLRDDVDAASRCIEHAVPVPEGTQSLFEGHALLVAGMVARRQGHAARAIELLDAAEGAIGNELHPVDRLRAERSAAYATLGDFKSAHREAELRAEAANHHNVRYMGAVIEQVRARAAAEQSRITLVEATESLTERSRRDDLTGVSSRGWFDSCFDERQNLPGDAAIVLIDLDHFKAINDTRSHQVGDDVLRRIGEILLAVSDDKDIVARYGGEEFVVLPMAGDLQGAQELGERIRKTIEDDEWGEIDDGLRVTASVGVCAGPASRLADILGTADGALYAAKNQGRNCVVGQPLRTRSTDLM